MNAQENSTGTLDRISIGDALFLDRVRGFSILRVVLVHLGLSWFYPPYSQFVHIFLPLLFFVSGAVSFFSFKRAPSLGNYTLRRTLSIIMPYYVIVLAAFIYLWFQEFRFPDLNIISLLKWLTIDPDHSEMPFPMGQVWFIHAMAIMIFLSLPVFLASRKSPFPLLIGALCSVVLSVIHQTHDVSNVFSIFGHNFYQALSNIGFFLFGAFYYSAKDFFSPRVLLAMLAVFFISMIFQVSVLNIDLNMANHTYSPDFYYLSGSFFAILLVLLCKPIIENVLEKIKILDWFFLFLSRHAYSVFMLHSLVLFLVETRLGLVDVASDPLAALSKIVLVISISCVVAIPVSKASKWVTTFIQDLFFDKSKKTLVSNFQSSKD